MYTDVPRDEEGVRTSTVYFPYIPFGELCCGGLVTGRTDEYRFLWYELDGTHSRIFSLQREPLAITDEDEQILMHQLDLWWQENRYSPQRVERLMEGFRIRETYPHIRFPLDGPAATLLVEQVRPLRDLDPDEQNQPRYIGASGPPGSPNWDVFDCEGRYLGVVVRPGIDPGLSFGSGKLARFGHDPTTNTWYYYSVWRDEMDVDYVVVWRIDGPMPG